MKKLKFTVPGDPVGKQRARTFRHKQGGRIVSMTPKKTVNYEALVRMAFTARYPKHIPFKGAGKMRIDIFIMASQDEARKLKKGLPVWPTKKPDNSNVQKAVEDALNGVCYVDDKQLIATYQGKHLSDRPRVEVEVEEIS